MPIAAPSDLRPVLIYDGDCAFCTYWARYWRALTGGNVRYEPYQRIAGDYPQIPLIEFQRAVQYVTPAGQIAAGAEASFRTLAHAPGKGFWLWLYGHLPGFAALSERSYALIARHRSVAYRVSLFLWGRDHTPPRFDLTIGLLLAGLALIYLAAFLSLGAQIEGLVGSDGLLPLRDYLAAAAQRFGIERYWLFPTVFWLDASDRALQAVCWIGALFSVLLLLKVWLRLSLSVLFILYLSLFYACQVFTSFQWDLLLLEAGFLALALCTRPPLAVWIARWLVFRFMFMSGLVKVMADAAWTDFTALRYHFETQPLPTPLAWYASRLPESVLRCATAATLAVELVLPFFIFLPRRLRFAAAWGFIVFQTAILITGNYNFFNLLTILLCLTLFDDAAMRRVLPQRLQGLLARKASGPQERRAPGRFASAYAAVSLLVGGVQLAQMIARSPLPEPLATVIDSLAPVRIVNRYGPFALMTTQRAEIIIEGSRDGEHWREYPFRYKPGEVSRRPPWNIPHQPRLDWQMWFAALGNQESNPWFERLLRGLLRNSPDIVALLAGNPFSGRPPAYVRALLYDYRFADPAQRMTGQWWVRQPIGLYYPAVGLRESP